MYSIHIANQQRLLRVNRPRLVELAEATLASERVRAADISVALVDDAQIHEINRNFLGHDYPTDVISFLLELKEPRRKPAPKRASRLSPEICREPPQWHSASQSARSLSKGSSRDARGSALCLSNCGRSTEAIARTSKKQGKARKPQAPGLKSSPRGAGKTLGGEIIISTEYAVASAADYGWRPINELSLYLVHGLLHLCGYDDLTPGEQRIMRQREVEVLAPWKIVPSYAI